MNLRDVEKAATGRVLQLPHKASASKLGDVLSGTPGSALDIHDFRNYQLGDDIRHIDWNAVARTNEWVVRVRQKEVSPRVEVLLDASKSMGLTDSKKLRAREVAALVSTVGHHQGLSVGLHTYAAKSHRCGMSSMAQHLTTVEFDGQHHLADAVMQGPPLRQAGLRIVVSDFLFDTPVRALAKRLREKANRLIWIQVLDDDDVAPPISAGARVVDIETGEEIEHANAESLWESFQKRWERHHQELESAARAVGGVWVSGRATDSIETWARSTLRPILT